MHAFLDITRNLMMMKVTGAKELRCSLNEVYTDLTSQNLTVLSRCPLATCALDKEKQPSIYFENAV